MIASSSTFNEAHLAQTPIRDLGLTIAGTRLEPLIQQFETELQQAGIRRLRPRFYLSTEWGVPFGTIAIAIPFYLARPELTAMHAERVGHIEGFNPEDIRRYLRHEMGHVVNYGYRLYDEPEWQKHFGLITSPYREEYRARPFSPRHVIHLPGWYAQKHPDEDWAETFAVWLTPGSNWRTAYARRPVALAKLNHCAETMARLAERDPVVTADDLDEDVSELAFSLEQFYRDLAWPGPGLTSEFDDVLRSIFERSTDPNGASQRRPASALIERLGHTMPTEVYRWTSHFPERTRLLLRHLAARAAELHLEYVVADEERIVVALTVLVTSLAMNHVHHGGYFPDTAASD